MATLNQIAYSILSSVKPHLSDDEDLRIEQVTYDINVERNALVRRDANKHLNLNPSIVQDLGCVEMELADSAECCDFSSECKVLRTKETIPTPVELYDKVLITRVGPIDKGSKQYNFVSYERAIFSGNGKFNKNVIYAYYMNNRIYLKSNLEELPMIKYINIRGVFEDPVQASKFKDCDENPCYTNDSAYPIASWMEKSIKEILIERYLKVQMQVPKDLGNDAKSQVTDEN
jgi:hypothetical protein